MSLSYARTHLSPLLERVARGESITITKHGEKVAVLVPAESKLKKNARQLADEYFAMTREVRLGKSVTVKSMIEEGRKL